MPRIIGHDRAVSTLQTAVAAKRLHHAWIFSGPRGVGKCTLAIELARVLLDKRVTEASLNSDDGGFMKTDGGPDSKLLLGGSHPDFHMIHRGLAAHSSNPQLRDRKQTNIPIDLLRETMLGGRTSDNRVHDAAAYRTSVMGSAKVFIVDEAERLDLPGQNALLKTLEEPPPATYIFLITSRPERLLPTILSRCQHLRLAPLTDTQMLEWFNQSEIDATPNVLDTAMTFAQGSPGMASLAITRDITKWIESVESILNALDDGLWDGCGADVFIDIVESWAESVVKDNPKASKDAANRDGIEILLRVLASHLRRSLRTTDNRSIMVENCWRIDRIAQAEAQIAAGLNLKHVLEALVAEWSCPVVH